MPPASISPRGSTPEWRKRPVERGDDVAARRCFTRSTPELVTSTEAQAALGVANADLAHPGGKADEEIAQKKAALDSCSAEYSLSAASITSRNGPAMATPRSSASIGQHHSSGRAARLRSGQARLSRGRRRLHARGTRDCGANVVKAQASMTPPGRKSTSWP